MLEWDETEREPFGQRGLRDISWRPMLALLLVVPLVLVALLMVRSYYRYDRLAYSAEGRRYFVTIRDGEFLTGLTRVADRSGAPWDYDTGIADRPRAQWPSALASLAGFTTFDGRTEYGPTKAIRVRFRSILILGVAPPVAVYLWRRRRRLSAAEESLPARPSSASAPPAP